MAKGKAVNQTAETALPPAGAVAPPAPGQIQVNQGNVPIVTVQLLAEINIKLGKLLALAEKDG